MSGGRLYRGLSLNLNRSGVMIVGNRQWTRQQPQQQQNRVNIDACSVGRDIVQRNLSSLPLSSSPSSSSALRKSITVPFYNLQQYCWLSDSSKNRSNNGDSSQKSLNINKPDQDSATHCWRCDAPVNGLKIFPDDPIVDDGPGGSTGASECSTASNDKNTSMLECAHCGALLPLGAGRDHFTLFSLPAVYELDLAELKRRYLGLQQTMHPDRNVNRDQTETGHALDNSSIINAAYKTLRDPYQRALYLLKLLYNIGIDEENVDTEPDMLLEIMELNEDIELATDNPHSMLDMISKIENDLTAILEGIKQAFRDKNGGAVRRLLIRYSYYNSALVKLKEHLNQHPSSNQ